MARSPPATAGYDRPTAGGVENCPDNGRRVKLVASKPGYCKDSGKIEYLQAGDLLPWAKPIGRADPLRLIYSGISHSGNQRAISASQGMPSLSSWALTRSSDSLSRCLSPGPGTNG